MLMVSLTVKYPLFFGRLPLQITLTIKFCLKNFRHHILTMCYSFFLIATVNLRRFDKDHKIVQLVEKQRHRFKNDFLRN